jgi:hypothetical protein
MISAEERQAATIMAIAGVGEFYPEVWRELKKPRHIAR